jgi:hypothetical protein
LTTSKTPHEWSKDAFLVKAQRYADMMSKQDHTDWQFGFWSALTLELLARAALAHISPALVADARSDWRHIYFALEHTPKNQRYSPTSVSTSEVFTRVEELIAEFTGEMKNFCSFHLNRRNNELHSGALPFDGLGTSLWLPMFYLTCRTLLDSMDKDLGFLFGEVGAKEADTHIQAYKDDAAKAVKGTIDAHKTVWQGKGEEEQTTLSKQSEIWAKKQSGHREACPSCECAALLHGDPIGDTTQQIEGDFIIEKQSMRPSKFECIACNLKISGFSKLNACGLGNAYTSKSTYEAADYFDITSDDEWDGMEQDNNE